MSARSRKRALVIDCGVIGDQKLAEDPGSGPAECESTGLLPRRKPEPSSPKPNIVPSSDRNNAEEHQLN